MDPHGPGWAQGSTVSYNTNYLPGGPIREAAEEAVRRWNSMNYYNASQVQLEPNGNALMFHVGNISNNTIGGTIFTSRESTSGQLQSAQIFIDPSKTTTDPNGNTVLWLDPSQPNYEDALIGLFMHEIGHTMGLDDVPIPDPSHPMNCGDYTRDKSVMNGFCGVNERGWDLQGGAQASSSTNCDNNFCNDSYQPPTTTTQEIPQHPPEEGGGENCYDQYLVETTWYKDGSGWHLWFESWYYLNTWCEP